MNRGTYIYAIERNNVCANIFNINRTRFHLQGFKNIRSVFIYFCWETRFFFCFFFFKTRGFIFDTKELKGTVIYDDKRKGLIYVTGNRSKDSMSNTILESYKKLLLYDGNWNQIIYTTCKYRKFIAESVFHSAAISCNLFNVRLILKQNVLKA